MLTARRERLLGLIVDAYVGTAQPVGSQTLARRYGLPISPATIRNEMTQLEAEGYVTHPHASAGRVPSDRGYRYFVESLMEEEELAAEEQRTIRHQFHQAAREMEEWLRLASTVLAQLARNMALVATTQGQAHYFRSLHLFALHDLLALLVLVLRPAQLRQQLIPLTQATTQGQLDLAANRLNSLLGGLAAEEIGQRSWELSPLEGQIVASALALMQEEAEPGQPYLQGLHHVLRQPEFAGSSHRAPDILEALDERNLAHTIPLGSIVEEGVTVIIGSENPQEIIRDCSLIVSRYGLPRQMQGVLAVLGPTRMHYPRTIAAVRYMASLVTELITVYYG